MCRKCNCDANDEIWRVDAGILQIGTDLPLDLLVFHELEDPLAQGTITLGQLYCGTEEFGTYTRYI